MQHIAPLIQTILWVLLVAGILWRFHKPLHAILTALAKRIESGSSLKAGPFELGDQVRPQSPTTQIQKLSADAIEASEIARHISDSETPPHAIDDVIVASQHLRAEDLALRVLQSEVGAVLSRQVIVGDSLEVDAAILRGSEVTLIEVKYIINHRIAEAIVRGAIDRITEGVRKDRKLRQAWPGIMLVLVFKDKEDIQRTRHAISAIAKVSALSVDVRSYWFEDLQRRFDAVHK